MSSDWNIRHHDIVGFMIFNGFAPRLSQSEVRTLSTMCYDVHSIQLDPLSRQPIHEHLGQRHDRRLRHFYTDLLAQYFSGLKSPTTVIIFDFGLPIEPCYQALEPLVPAFPDLGQLDTSKIFSHDALTTTMKRRRMLPVYMPQFSWTRDTSPSNLFWKYWHVIRPHRLTLAPTAASDSVSLSLTHQSTGASALGSASSPTPTTMAPYFATRECTVATTDPPAPPALVPTVALQLPAHAPPTTTRECIVATTDPPAPPALDPAVALHLPAPAPPHVKYRPSCLLATRECHMASSDPPAPPSLDPAVAIPPPVPAPPTVLFFPPCPTLVPVNAAAFLPSIDDPTVTQVATNGLVRPVLDSAATLLPPPLPPKLIDDPTVIQGATDGSFPHILDPVDVLPPLPPVSTLIVDDTPNTLLPSTMLDPVDVLPPSLPPESHLVAATAINSLAPPASDSVDLLPPSLPPESRLVAAAALDALAPTVLGSVHVLPPSLPPDSTLIDATTVAQASLSVSSPTVSDPVDLLPLSLPPESPLVAAAALHPLALTVLDSVGLLPPPMPPESTLIDETTVVQAAIDVLYPTISDPIDLLPPPLPPESPLLDASVVVDDASSPPVLDSVDVLPPSLPPESTLIDDTTVAPATFGVSSPTVSDPVDLLPPPMPPALPLIDDSTVTQDATDASSPPVSDTVADPPPMSPALPSFEDPTVAALPPPDPIAVPVVDSPVAVDLPTGAPTIFPVPSPSDRTPLVHEAADDMNQDFPPANDEASFTLVAAADPTIGQSDQSTLDSTVLGRLLDTPINLPPVATVPTILPPPQPPPSRLHSRVAFLTMFGTFAQMRKRIWIILFESLVLFCTFAQLEAYSARFPFALCSDSAADRLSTQQFTFDPLDVLPFRSSSPTVVLLLSFSGIICDYTFTAFYRAVNEGVCYSTLDYLSSYNTESPDPLIRPD